MNLSPCWLSNMSSYQKRLFKVCRAKCFYIETKVEIQVWYLQGFVIITVAKYENVKLK